MRKIPKSVFTVFASCLLGFLAAAAAVAQAQATETRTVAFEIVSVTGNTIVWKDEAGTTKEFRAPAGFKLDMDGKELGVADLKPGMKGTATVMTKTTMKPVTVTEVKNGQVIAVVGNTVIVRDQDGVAKKFTEPDIRKRGIKLYRDGKPAQLSQFRANDKLSAVFVTDGPPETVTDREMKAVVEAPAAPAPVAAAEPAPAPEMEAPAAPAPATLPKTGSPLPLIGLLGALSLAVGFGMTALRRSRVAP